MAESGAAAAPRPRGRPRTLTREAVVEAAVRVMDRAGVDAIAIRPVAAELGVHPSSLYTYVTSRDDLVLAVARHVLAQSYGDMPRPQPRRGDVIDYLHGMFRAMSQHPELLRLIYAATDLFEQSYDAADAILQYLLDRGLSADDAHDAYIVLFTFTVGAAVAAHSLDPEEMQRQRSALAERATAPEFAHLPALRAAFGKAPAAPATFETQLGLLLDRLAPATSQ